MIYAITNKHVLAGEKSVFIRWDDYVNHKSYCNEVVLKDSGVMPNYFKCSKPEVDLAAVTFTAGPPDSNLAVFDYPSVMGRDKMKRWGIAEGTDVVMTGYQFGCPGIRRIYPITRFGKVSLISDENWFNIGDLNEQAYMIEIGTTYGASGSPVFLNPLQFRLLSTGRLNICQSDINIFGVVKGMPTTFAPLKGAETIYAEVSPGLAAIEPGENLKFFLKELAASLHNIGFTVDLNSQLSGDAHYLRPRHPD
jgi:hypothetical protein